MNDKTVRLWRVDSKGDNLLITLSRSSYSSADSFQEAIDFHIERGAELEEDRWDTE